MTINCSGCTPREAMIQLRIEMIKMDILRKLRMSAPPNMTGRSMPNIPYLRDRIGSGGGGHQQNDAPYRDADDDDDMLADDADSPTTSGYDEPIEYATTERIIMFAHPR